MKPIPVELVPLSEMSPIRERLLGSMVLSPHKGYGCQYAGHTDASTLNEASIDPCPQLKSLAKGIASLPDPVASAVKVLPGEVDGDATIEIPLPGGGIAWIGFFQSLGDGKTVVLCQTDLEDEPMDVSRTINPRGLDLRLDQIYSRLCSFVGGESTSPARNSSPADDTGKSKAVTAVSSKGSSGDRKRSGKSTPAKKKVRRTRPRRGKGKTKQRSKGRKHKKGKR
ncbi:hypothetical protein PDESU_02042 [Pontiella desulfatans]|uniref:Uncharacterized protein n=2 Tax=Pontiella desulfatans TaxID=2750659 RepID=A0A6C2U0T7_PONDE|nr:hypothetical protein PDESU_02042 [Pontiella desulfatans]